MRVFVSYAHTDSDAALAEYIVTRLRAAGTDVWWDRSELHAALPTREAIQQGADSCDVAVFLVSDTWLVRDFTEWELQYFKQRDPSGTRIRRIPVVRRANLLPPAELVRFVRLLWTDDERDTDARFWELYCAVQGKEPGPPSDWARSGRELGPTTAPAPLPSRRACARRPSLPCNRASQWNTLDTLAGSGRHELFLIPGTPGQDHDHFLERIQHLFRPEPPRSIVRVDWVPRPTGAEEYREALASALGAAPDRLAAALSARLAHMNVVLLHPSVRSRFTDPRLADYYATWLPQWLAEAQPRMALKCVQPIEWPTVGLIDWLFRLVPGRTHADENDRTQAEQLLQRILDAPAEPLRRVRVRELGDVTEQDLDDFCRDVGLTAAQQQFLLERIESRRPRSPRDVFKAIDDFMPDVPDARKERRQGVPGDRTLR